MSFNHYAKIKRILSDKTSWRVVRINEPTTAKNFSGETRKFDHYYRILDSSNNPIPFCKFQQIDKFASVMDIDVSDLVIIEKP